jgi:serine phosphatase RsbU (regulator of sigma subunit)/ABC-type phosphate transport system ATPase subunit
VKVLTPLASQVAVAVENARLYEELKKNEERLHKELIIAQGIQRGLFPEDCPSGPGWEASAHFRPARELGGDLYDFFDMGEGVLGVAAGDVAGKGVPAALYGAFASGTVRARAFQRRGPADLMMGVNRTLRRRGVEGLYCTLGYALFDFRGRSLRLANSGLPYPLLFRANSGRSSPIEVGGLPLGCFDSVAYDEKALELSAGDVFVFHTDGLTEARRGGEEYGVARLGRQIEEHARLSAPRLGERILEDVDQFMGDALPTDDVTLILDGVDIRELPPPQLRSSLALVLQDVHLFSGTIASNIRLGSAIPEERVREAARAIHAHHFIEALPQGYETEVKERGATLSVGQKHLLSFARALAHDPRVLVLDEATSSVDTETEQLMQDALRVLLKGRTAIVIAHRLSTIQNVDEILVMHKGRIRERGTHQELLAERGIYWRLYQLQYKDQELRVPGREEATA